MKNLLKLLIIFLVFNGKQSPAQKLDTLAFSEEIKKRIDNKLIFGIQLSVKKGDEIWTGSAGNLTKKRPVFIASTTKLYTTAILLMLRNEGKLKLTDPIGKYLSEDLLKGLHIYRGQEYSHALTLKHLLSHTSGLPDYFEDKPEGGKSFSEQLLREKDFGWTPYKVIEVVKNIPAKFPPGKKGKAHYSDTNFQLLGLIIEKITGKSYAENLQERIVRPLSLKHTYLYSSPSDTTPANMYYKQHEIFLPQAMSSFGADGGIVSTSEEMIIFLSAFFEGRLFPENYLQELYHWNPIMFPLQSGVGLLRIKLPTMPECIGHSGLSGAFAYYVPSEKLYIAGTVNQIHKPATSYNLMMRIIALQTPR